MTLDLTLHARSTALFSTWFFLDELRLMLDLGDGAMAELGHRTRSVRAVAISHADRDHLMALPQFLHHNALHGLGAVLHPAGTRQFEAMRDFSERFDPFTKGVVPWVGMNDGDEWELHKGLLIRAVRNTHMDGPRVRSLGYRVVRTYRKLRPELEGTPGPEIARLRREGGDDAVTRAFEETLLAYSGDTGEMPGATWGPTDVLLHEATFLNAADRDEERPGHRHCTLDGALRVAADARPNRLVLSHFSSRYTKDEIVRAVAERGAGLGFPIWVVPPMRTVWDLLRGEPVVGG